MKVILCSWSVRVCRSFRILSSTEEKTEPTYTVGGRAFRDTRLYYFASYVFLLFFLFRTVLNSVHDKMILSLQLSCLCAIEFTVGVCVCV
jgi:hypothetical protein